MLSVIMAGGVGERFWPLSRRTRPKQLLDLTGRGTMIGLTVARLRGLSSPEQTYVITNVEQREAIVDAVRDLVPAENVIGEPVGLNTAPCIGLAATLLRREHGNEPMLVLPADHLIDPVEEFQRVVRVGAGYVRDNQALLTFGIKPTRPETGYGYVQAGEVLADSGGVEVCRVAAFLEKPDAASAQRFVADGRYFWNSGMFMWTPESILAEIAEHIPELDRVLGEIAGRVGTQPLAEVLNSLYPQAPSISIDYGVMERAANVSVLKTSFSWNDVGSWEFVRDINSADDRGNVSVGDHILIDADNNTVFAPERMVSIIGVDDIVVVDASDSLLICKRNRVQEVKSIVKVLRERGRDDLI